MTWLRVPSDAVLLQVLNSSVGAIAATTGVGGVVKPQTLTLLEKPRVAEPSSTVSQTRLGSAVTTIGGSTQVSVKLLNVPVLTPLWQKPSEAVPVSSIPLSAVPRLEKLAPAEVIVSSAT